MKAAILVDGGFFIKRHRSLYRDAHDKTPKQVARDLYAGLLRDLRGANKNRQPRELYRIFYYDCPPLAKRVHNPVTKRAIDLKQSPESRFRTQFHEELKCMRKVALRLGRLSDNASWVIAPLQTKALLNRKISIEELTASDVRYDARQKGVDMKIGLDIASLAYKKAVDQVILIAGDSDFVPAAKLARREGVDFVLDPMWNPINPDLHEHIDGLISEWPRPQRP